MHCTVAAAASIDSSSINTIIQPYRKYVHPLSRSSAFLNNQSICIVCAETTHYRKLCVSHIISGDRVLEIGCSFGKATQIILKQTDIKVIAVDNSDECTESTAKLNSDAIESGRLIVKTIDVLSNLSQCISLGHESNVIFVDIGGNREYTSVLSILLLLVVELKPILIAAKCRELHSKVIENETNFWEWAVGEMKQNAILGQRDMNPLSAPDEKRICYSFLNRGVCKYDRCVYRHLTPLHPDAIADKQKRAQPGWTHVKRYRSKMGKNVDLDLLVMLILTLILLIAIYFELSIH